MTVQPSYSFPTVVAALIGLTIFAATLITHFFLGEFRSRAVFPDISNLRAVSVEGYYSITLHEDGWQTEEGLRVAPQALEELLKNLSALQYEPTPTPVERPATRATSITTTLGSKTLTLVLASLQPNAEVRYAWRENEGQVFLLSEKIVQRILQSELLLQTPLRFDPSRLSVLSLRRPGLNLPDLRFERINSKWRVSNGDSVMRGDPDDINSFLHQLANMQGIELSTDALRQLVSEATLATFPFLVGELHFASGQKQTLLFYEAVWRPTHHKKTEFLVKRDTEQTYFTLRSPLPTEININAEMFRSRSLFAGKMRSLPSFLCVFRGDVALFQLRSDSKQLLISRGCTAEAPEKPVITSLAKDIVRLRVMTFTSQLPPPSVINNEEPPVRLTVYRSTAHSDRQERFSVTLRLPTRLEAAPWAITVNTNEEQHALISPTTGNGLLREIRLLEDLVNQ